jgi:Laminin G domain
MRGVRLHLVAGVGCVLLVGACSLLTTFDGFSGGSCETDLSNIGTADFTITVTVTTTQTGTVAIVNQRAVCNGSDFWDVHLQDGDVQAETDDGLMHHTTVNTPGPAVNDGKPHAIRVQRRNELLTVSIDGVAAGSAMSVSAFGALPHIVWGNGPCVGHTNYYSLVGSLTNGCVTSP